MYEQKGKDKGSNDGRLQQTRTKEREGNMSIRLQLNDTDFMCVDLGEEGKLKGRGGEREAGSAEKEAQSGCVQYP